VLSDSRNVAASHKTACNFTTTRWSVVLRAGGSTPEQSRAALEQLCGDYWYPLYAYVRRKGYDPHSAADLTQEFFAKLLAADFASGLVPAGGRFRSYLLTCLNRFLISEWQKAQRQKRGGGASITSIDAAISERGEGSYLAELSHDDSPDRLFQRAWAETLLHRVLERLEGECAKRGDGRFQILGPFLAAGDDPPSLAEAAMNLGLSVPAFKSLLHRFRQRYRELLFEEISQTVGGASDVTEELRGLLLALRGK
jgi:DNA-directed RNA polymerase specialized sigma24 family protein